MAITSDDLDVILDTQPGNVRLSSVFTSNTEPTLREMILKYYAQWMDSDRVNEVTDEYVKALKEQL